MTESDAALEPLPPDMLALVDWERGPSATELMVLQAGDLLMFDTAASNYGPVPSSAYAVEPYMDGNFDNIDAAKAHCPGAFKAGRVFSLTCRANDAAGVDWERGNTCPPPSVWYRQQRDRGRFRPGFYADLSDMIGHIIPALNAAGLEMGAAGGSRPVRLVTAHPTGGKHLCGPHTCGGLPVDADATQFWWSSLQGPFPGTSGDIDVSVIRADFFGGTPDLLSIFPTKIPGLGNERKTFQEARGALKQIPRYRHYLVGKLYPELKAFRDRIKRVSLFRPPHFVVLRRRAAWGGDHRGKRWQELNDVMKQIALLARPA